MSRFVSKLYPIASCDAPPLSRELLFIHKSWPVFLHGLKGQNSLAQGKVEGGTNRNAAMGKGFRRKAVRAKMLTRTKSLFRTESQYVIFRKHEVLCLVQNKIFSLMDFIARTIFLSALQPRATLRLPWANIYCPFRTKNLISFIANQ